MEGVEFRKVGESFKMLIPSQALNREGVETRHGTPKSEDMVKV